MKKTKDKAKYKATLKKLLREFEAKRVKFDFYGNDSVKHVKALRA